MIKKKHSKHWCSMKDLDLEITIKIKDKVYYQGPINNDKMTIGQVKQTVLHKYNIDNELMMTRRENQTKEIEKYVKDEMQGPIKKPKGKSKEANILISDEFKFEEMEEMECF